MIAGVSTNRKPGLVKDPRLRLSVVIMSLQLLGQVVLGFKVSIAQVALSIGTCVVIEATITLMRGGGLRWPASAMLTGNGIALILRAAGTRHGDWWSLNGAQFFIAAAAVGIGSKYLVRAGGRHVFNPSNLGLVAAFIVFGPAAVYPQYLWWGPLGPAVVAAWVVIALGAVWVLRPLRMWPLALAFAVPFIALVSLFAATGACFDATWRVDSVCGLNYWIGMVASPEVAIFALFMMSDPRTVPGGRRERLYFGAATGLCAAALLYFQPTEYGVKVSILAALVVVCSITLFWRRAVEWWQQRRPLFGEDAALETSRPLVRPGVLASAAILILVSGSVLLMGGNQQLIQFERGGPVTSGDIPKQ